VPDKLIAYEAVHEIKGRDDLLRRLAPDRRSFAFFHPAQGTARSIYSVVRSRTLYVSIVSIFEPENRLLISVG
jgi:Malonyl-CoA decarboxylase C-terminal domain